MNYLRLTQKEQIWGWFWLAVHVFILPTAIALAIQLMGLTLTMSNLNIVMFFVTFAVTVVIFHRYLLVQLKCVRWKTLLWVVIGLGMYNLLTVAASYTTTLIQPVHINANNETVKLLLHEQPILFSIGSIILAPVFEEVLYRGLVFGSMYKIHPVLGYIGTTVLFAAAHLIGFIGIQDWLSIGVSFIQYIPAGIALSFAYERSGTLVAPIIMHTAINLIATLQMR